MESLGDKSPWQIGVHKKTIEELRPNQIEDFERDTQQQLRRSKREKKPNPKYAICGYNKRSQSQGTSEL